MATSSIVGYETETGSYVGVYCHFDGYESHMMPQLKEMSWMAVKCEVDKALYKNAGARQLKNCVMECYKEAPSPDKWGCTEWPATERRGFVIDKRRYRKRLDGTVEVIC
jgi:hypothetical protein